MAHPFSEHNRGRAKAEAMCRAEGGRTKLAGDVIDIGPAMSNIQQSNAITRSLDRANQILQPKAPVVPIAQSGTKKG